MNRQDIWKDGVLIKRGIEWCMIHGRPGFTSNPVSGCEHECEWQMPDGTWVRCYAKDVALGVAQSNYPHGFESIAYHPEEHDAIRRRTEPSGIFLGSMSDLFGRNVASAEIVKVLETVRACPQHIFFTLTKNPTRLPLFPQLAELDNLLCGISAPPSKMFGKELTLAQQDQWLTVGLERLIKSGAKWPWISIEPLSFDIVPILAKFRRHLRWAVVGAASGRGRKYQPKLEHLRGCLAELLSDQVPVFFKGNLDRGLAELCAGQWMENFPTLDQPKAMQEALL